MDKIHIKDYIINYRLFDTARVDIIKNGSDGFVILALTRNLRLTFIQYDHPGKNEKVYVTDTFGDFCTIEDDFGNSLVITGTRTNDFDTLCTLVIGLAERDDTKHIVNIRDGEGFCILRRRRGQYKHGSIIAPDVYVTYYGNFKSKSPALSLQTIFTTLFDQVSIQHQGKISPYWGGFDTYGNPIGDITGFTLKLQPLYVTMSELDIPGNYQEIILRAITSIFCKYYRPKPPIMTPYGYLDMDDDD